MTVTITTSIGFNGTAENATVQEIVDALNGPAPVFSLGDDVALIKEDVRTVYNGEPEEGTANQFTIHTRGGEQFVITMPEGQGATSIMQQINEHAKGEVDRWGNRIVAEQFITIGDTHAVGLRYNEFRFAQKVQ